VCVSSFEHNVITSKNQIKCLYFAHLMSRTSALMTSNSKRSKQRPTLWCNFSVKN